jgi:hypothetical protein
LKAFVVYELLQRTSDECFGVLDGLFIVQPGKPFAEMVPILIDEIEEFLGVAFF